MLYADWRRALIRLIALTSLALALAAPLAVGIAPAASAAPAACGTAKSGCGPAPCVSITPQDYTLPATSPRGGARAWLSRAGGAPDTTNTLTGSGWPAGATVELLLGSHDQGSIVVDPTPFAQGVADASGRVTIAAFHAPGVDDCTIKDGSALGDNQALVVAQTPDGRARISLLYTFYPMPTLQNSVQDIVSGGEAILMSGSGWEPGQTVTITPAFQRWPASGYPSYDPSSFQPLPANSTTVTAQPDGTFATGVTVPQEPPETQITYIASANGPRNGDVTVEASICFIGPIGTSSLAVNGNAAYAGANVTVTGRDWPANQDIQIEYCRRQAQAHCDAFLSETLAVVMTDARGGFTATVQLPPNARPGPIMIQASPVSSPFDPTVYTQTQPFAVRYPFALAHPRLEMAIHASPFAAAALLIALLALGERLVSQRRKRPEAV